ncbi:MAG: lipase family protein [Cyanobium sp.]
MKGTAGVTDWKTSLSFLFKHEDTHDGFRRNAWELAIQMLLKGEFINVARDDLIVISGHSLGGATAVVLLDLLQNYHTNLALVTFGSPRPGGRQLRRRVVHYPHYRFVYGSDVVPLCPPVVNRYVHTHSPIFLPDFKQNAMDLREDNAITTYHSSLKTLLAGKETIMIGS